MPEGYQVLICCQSQQHLQGMWNFASACQWFDAISCQECCHCLMHIDTWLALCWFSISGNASIWQHQTHW